MRKKRFTPLLVGLLAFGLVYGLYNYTRILTGFERLAVDGYFYLREPGPREVNPYVSDRVLLTGFDEDAIAIIGKWPWKRYVHAEFLHTAQRFSPQTVFFDVIFAKYEEIPGFVKERLLSDPSLYSKVERSYAAMDMGFADILSRQDNVFLDLQLVEQPRTDLPEEFQQRIRFNEKILERYSLPEDGLTSPLVFHSLEPILQEYVEHARPVVINVPKGPDGVIRLFPLFYTYRKDDGTAINVPTVVATLLLEYYHIDFNHIDLYADRVVFHERAMP